MDMNLELLSIQNPWWKSAGNRKKAFSYFELGLPNHEKAWQPDVLKPSDLKPSAIFILNGLYGAGKTSIIKKIILDLLKKNIDPKKIFYYSCHNLDSYEQLNELIKLFLTSSKNGEKYIFIDEVTLIKDWRKGIRYMQSSGRLDGVSLVLAGSTLAGKKKDFEVECREIHGLDFKDFLNYLNPQLFGKIKKNEYQKYSQRLEYYLDIYFLTGGLIGPLENYFLRGGVEQIYYQSYLNRLIADLAKMGRDPILFRQIMEQIIINIGEPLGYKTIAKKTKAKTHLTISEYLEILEQMMVIETVYQMEGGRLTSRKAKKIYFTDPFLFWLFYSYIHGSINPWQFSRERLHHAEVFDCLIENIVFSHLAKIKNSSEGEIAYWRDNKKKKEINFLFSRAGEKTPIMLRFGEEIKEEDYEIFKLAGFEKGIIISKDTLDLSGKIKVMPLTYFLLFYR